MQTICFNNHLYYSADELKKNYKNYFKGIRSVKEIIKSKNINSDDYAVVKKKGDELVICDNLKYCRAKILLKKEFCNINIINPPSPKKKIFIKNSEKNIENKNIEEKEVAPPILFLNEEEMFKDVEGNILDIEVRGERDRKKIYFKVSDIAKEFDSPLLKKSLTNVKSEFERNIHFKTFTCLKTSIINGRENTSKKLSLFLTYKGLLRFLFVSRNKCAEAFQDWAEEKLFTVQMGEQQDKDKLGSKLQNINYRDFKNVFRRHCNKLSVIYLIKIGKVNKLRDVFNIPVEISDENCLYKFGFTDDLNRRFREHCSYFDKYEDVSIDLEMFSFVDPKFMSKAELKIKNLNEAYQKDFQFENSKELIILDEKQEKMNKEYFKMISREYAGYSEELQKNIRELEQEIMTLKLSHEIEMLKIRQENELLEKENKYLIERHQIELENRDLKIKLLELEK